MNIALTEQDYYDHWYNDTIVNERCVEIPIGVRYTKDFPDFVEIGAVMPYYGYTNHPVYDPFDPHDGCIKERAENVDWKGKNVLSLSTIEHMGDSVGWGQSYIAKEPSLSQTFIERLLTEANSSLISIPVGTHPVLMRYFLRNIKQFNRFAYYKESQSPVKWVLNMLETDKDIEFIVSKSYMHPFLAANAVIFLTKNVELKVK